MEGVTISELCHQEGSEDLLSVQPHFLSAAQKQKMLSINLPIYTSAQQHSQDTLNSPPPLKSDEETRFFCILAERVWNTQPQCYLSVWAAR